MAWIYLLIAGCFEVAWAVGMKYSEGFSKFWPSAFTVVGMVLSFYFLALALKEIPLGTAYAVWTGIGAVGTATFGIILFQESGDLVRCACMLLIVSGIVGLKIFS